MPAQQAGRAPTDSMSHTSRYVEDEEGSYWEIVTPGGEPGYEHGRRFSFSPHPHIAAERWQRKIEDSRARRALERAGHAGGFGVTVRAEESALVDKLVASQPRAGNGYAVRADPLALAEALANGSVDSSLLEEPRAAA